MQKKKIKIGLTGGIGSGKTTVAKLFEIFSIPVYYSDLRAKYVIHHNQKVISKIKERFGDESYDKNGNYNAKYIANIVFQNKEKLNQLNKIVHPSVFQDRENWLKNLDSPYCIIENAILFEIGQQDYYDKIIVVQSDDDLRIQRIQQRDSISREAVLRRFSSQLPQDQKVDLADFVIYNNGHNSLVQQVNHIHEQFIS